MLVKNECNREMVEFVIRRNHFLQTHELYHFPITFIFYQHIITPIHYTKPQMKKATLRC